MGPIPRDPREAEDPVICQAAKYGDIAAVRHFLRTDPDAVHRADRNDPHEAEDPVICQAAKYGDIAAVRHFLRTDPDAVHRADRNGHTPLQTAAAHGHGAVVARLLELRASVAPRDFEGRGPRRAATAAG
eukprot:Skav214610  [mRNA]  locus=scaffold57:1018090:1021133:- [translate_table: standard]